MRWQDRYDSLFKFYAEENGFTGRDWLRFKAQVRAESGFNPDAKSAVGALGLAQFMPMTWKEWHDGTPGIQTITDMLKMIDPCDPEDSIKAQTAYMKWLLARMTTWDRAFAAYNWGIGNMMRLKTDADWKPQLPKETSDYIYRIDEFYREYLAG